MLGRLDLLHIINLRTLTFIIKIIKNPVTPVNIRYYMSSVYNVSNECATLFKKFNCDPYWSIPMIKRHIYCDFSLSCASPS